MFKTWFRIRGLFDDLGAFVFNYVLKTGIKNSWFFMVWDRFSDRILSIRIELHVHILVQNLRYFWWSGTGLEIGFWAFVFNYKRFWRKKYMILIVSSSFFEPSVWRYVFFTRFLLCFFDLNGKSWFNHENSTSYLSTPAKHCSKISVF